MAENEIKICVVAESPKGMQAISRIARKKIGIAEKLLIARAGLKYRFERKREILEISVTGYGAIIEKARARGSDVNMGDVVERVVEFVRELMYKAGCEDKDFFVDGWSL